MPQPKRGTSSSSGSSKSSGSGSSRSRSTKASSGSSGSTSGRKTARSGSGSRSGTASRSASGSSRSASSRSTAGQSRSPSSSRSSSARRAASPDPRIEAIATRLRKLNERIIEAGRDAGETTLTTYEKALKTIATGIEKGPGSSDVDWISHMATAQAKFLRDVTESWAKAARGVLK